MMKEILYVRDRRDVLLRLEKMKFVQLVSFVSSYFSQLVAKSIERRKG